MLHNVVTGQGRPCLEVTKIKTVTILKQGLFWSMYFKGFDFPDYVSPTKFSVKLTAPEVLKKLQAIPANKDVQVWKIAD